MRSAEEHRQLAVAQTERACRAFEQGLPASRTRELLIERLWGVRDVINDAPLDFIEALIGFTAAWNSGAYDDV